MIPVKNIYYMLSYAFKTLRESGYRSIEAEDFDNVAELCSEILFKGVSSQIKQGLYKEYIPVIEKTSSLKGKIDFTASQKKNTMINAQMICSYDDFSTNSYLNQIIKTTIMYLIRSDISPKRKKNLKKIIIFFSDVDEIDINSINWKIRFTRNNKTYEMLISICELVINGLLQSQKDGTYKIMDYLDEQHMHRLYEKFILEFYRKERKDLSANPIQIPWALDDDYDDMLPTMQTDITLSKDDKVLIIDAKYYSHSTISQYNTQNLISGNLYQIYTYVKNEAEKVKEEDKTVEGMLLYAKTDDEIALDNKKYSMSGNIIMVHSLDLNRNFSHIARQLNNIVDSSFN